MWKYLVMYISHCFERFESRFRLLEILLGKEVYRKRGAAVGWRTMHPATVAAAVTPLGGGRRLTCLTSEHRRNIDAQYRSPLHFLELWSITDALSRRRGSATTIRGREEGRKWASAPSSFSHSRHDRDNLAVCIYPGKHPTLRHSALNRLLFQILTEMKYKYRRTCAFKYSSLTKNRSIIRSAKISQTFYALSSVK